MSGRPVGAELERLRRIDRLCESAEQGWKRGERPRIEDSLGQSSAEDREALLSELLMLEWSYRRGSGERFAPEEYASRFGDQTRVVEEAWQRWLGGETAAASVAPDTVMPSPDPTHRPARAEEPADAPLPGGYADWVFVGEGGMGAVYRAHDPRLRRTVAVKKLHALTPSRLARFRTEAEALARLSHPHIVQVYALEEIEAQPCLVMEYIAYGSLEDRLLGRKALAPAEAARLVAILARAVQAAHAKGIVHRDLKPGNVLMAEPVEGSGENILGGFPKVSDFGLARLAGGDQAQTGTGQVLGTPYYMAPEQAQGRVRDIGPASDVWALGVILYRCLSGHLPFRGESTLETLNKVSEHTPERFAALGAAVPEALEALCLRCLEKESAGRPAAGELAEALERFVGRVAHGGSGGSEDLDGPTTTLEPGAIETRSDTQVLPAPAKPSRRGLLIGGGALALVLAGVAAGWALLGSGGRDEAKDNGKPAVTPDGVVKVTDRDRDQGRKATVPLVKALRVKHWVDDPKSPWVEIGNESIEARFEDHVRVEAEFSEPLYAYLIAFNADGKEQLLLPASERKEMMSDEQAKPEAVRSLKFPHPERAKYMPDQKPAVFILNDEEAGGTQAFAVVASRKPLPPYAEWAKQRGKATWKREPLCVGVWGYGPGGWEKIRDGKRLVRGGEAVEKGVPPLQALYESLKKGDVEVVELIAFMVKPKE